MLVQMALMSRMMAMKDDDDERGKRCQKLDGQQCWPEAQVKK